MRIRHRPPSRRVLLVDDDEPFLDSLAMNLEDEGFEPICRSDSAAALGWLLAGGQCDAILLDWFMPKVPGLSFLTTIRGAGVATPVIVFTGAGNDALEDTALGSGANDFVDKSRRFSVVVRRLRLVLDGRGHNAVEEPAETELGALRLLRDCRRAHWKGREVALSLVEYRIVERLALQAGTDLAYRAIYDLVHGPNFVAGDGEDGFRINVRSLIRNIRRKFREIDDGFDTIESRAGFGYRWRAAPPAARAMVIPERPRLPCIGRHLPG